MVDSTLRSVSSDELNQMLPTVLGWIPEPELALDNTALVIIDMQYKCAHPDYGVGAKAKEHGWDGFDSFWARLDELVLPNLQRLLDTARKVGLEIIHVRIASRTRDGRDSSARFKAYGMPGVLDSKEVEFLPEVVPQGDEIIVDKSTSSVFNSTNIDRLLRNLGIRNLIVTGCTTNGCVESSTRSAYEHDYGVIVVEDATAAIVPQLHENAVLNMKHQQIAFFKSTGETIKLLEAL